MAITKTPRLDQTRWSSGQDLVKREDFDSDASELEANAAIFKEGPLSSRPAAGVHGRFFTVVGDANPALNGRQYYDNGAGWSAIGYANNLLVESIGAGDSAAIVRAQPSPTANIFAVQDSSSQNHLVVTPTGYTTTQRTPGVSGGVELGYNSSHDQAGLFVSVDAQKPVIVVKGADAQNRNLLEFYQNNALVAYVNQTGGAKFSQSIDANGVTSHGPITAPSITSSGSSNLFDVTATPSNTTAVALTAQAIVGQSSNLIEMKNAVGTRTARFIQDGTFATSGRVFVGGKQGDNNPLPYAPTDAIVNLHNSAVENASILNLYSDTSSTAFQIFDQHGGLTYFVDSSGNAHAASNIDTSTLSVGTQFPAPYFNSTTPRFEVVTGTVTGTYNEGVTLRHPNTSTSAVNRELGLRIKMSDESTQTESNKWAGVTAYSTSANAANVGLALYASGGRAATFDSSKNLVTYGSVTLANSNALHFSSGGYNRIFLNESTTSGLIGMQAQQTMFLRSDNIALYSGGIFNGNSLNSGGGVTMAQFTPDRALINKLTIANPTAYDSTAAGFQIGTTQHMQFSTLSINTYEDAANTKPAELNLCNNNGRLRLGNTMSTVSLPSRVLWVGNIDDQNAANAIVFARSSAGDFRYWTGRGPQNGDWWFDHTNNRINVHDGNTWHVFVPDHTDDVVSD